MPQYDDRYITVLGYDLTGSVIERIDLQGGRLDMYLSTHRMDIPNNVPRLRADMRYLLSFESVQALRTDFSLIGELAERLESEGNEILAYGFLDEKLSEEQTVDALAVYFDTDWGPLEVASASIKYSL